MSNCLLFPWVLPLRWSIQIFFYDNNLPGTCMFFHCWHHFNHHMELVCWAWSTSILISLTWFCSCLKRGNPKQVEAKNKNGKFSAFTQYKQRLSDVYFFATSSENALKNSHICSAWAVCCLCSFKCHNCLRCCFRNCVGNIHICFAWAVCWNCSMFTLFPKIETFIQIFLTLLIADCLIVALVGGLIPLIITPWAFLSFGGWQLVNGLIC